MMMKYMLPAPAMSKEEYEIRELKLAFVTVRYALRIAVKMLVRLNKGGSHRPDRTELKDTIAHLKRFAK